MNHTGMHIGNGVLIHCSGEVKQGKVTDKGWTHYAVPKGLAGDEPVPEPAPEPQSQPVQRPMLRKGSRGDAVQEMQARLIGLGYDLGRCGADGIFGKMTLAAVKAFQKDCRIGVDGIVGRITYDCLWQESRK